MTLGISGATFSDDGQYRYELWRRWDIRAAELIWLMLNPSTADAEQDDPTIRRCIAFAREWGYGGVRILNLFALRSTDPKLLYAHPDPVGPENASVIAGWLWARDRPAIAAWGVHGALHGRGPLYLATYPHLQTLGTTKGGHPRHPLYLPRTTLPRPQEVPG